VGVKLVNLLRVTLNSCFDCLPDELLLAYHSIFSEYCDTFQFRAVRCGYIADSNF